MTSSTCDIPQEIVDEFRKFKLGNKHTSGIIYKVNKDKLLVEVEHVLENTPFDDLKEYLPESAPRFIAYSYKHTHSDGRSSMPLVLVFYCPPDINTTLAMLYSSTKTKLINALQVMKTFDIQDPEQLGEKWLKEKLKFFD